jgi:hypothetical protein
MGGQYQPLAPNEKGYLWSEQLGLYLGIFDRKLRYFRPDGELVPTPQESALQEKLAKEEAQKQAAILAEKLKELGINPNEIIDRPN